MATRRTQKAEVTTAASATDMTNTVAKKRVFNSTDLIAVKNGLHGRLIYKSKRNPDVVYNWYEFGQEEYMELAELVSARNTSKRFFSDNLWIIEDPEVLDYLGVSQYYKNSLSLEEFDELLASKPTQVSKVKETISKLSKGQKKSLAYRAKSKITSGELDSRKIIEAFEEALGVELIER